MTEVSNYPGAANFRCQTNQDFDYTLTWKVDGTAVNLTGGSAVMMLKDPGTATPVLSLSSGSGLTLGGTAGTIRIQITNQQMATVGVGVYEYDLVVSAPNETPLIRGSFTVNAGVSTV